MFSKNLKKKVAVLLTGVMVLGMTVTAFAGETTGNGGSNGTGNFEGHVNRDVVEVVLPTIPEGSTPFNFIYDPEGLIAETSAEAYGADYAQSFPAGQIFFKTGDKEFADTSTEFTVSNNSAVSVNVVLEVEVVEKEGQAALATGAIPGNYDGSDPSTSKDPTIKLDLITSGTVMSAAGYDTVGTKQVSTNKVTRSFAVDGKIGNYEVSANEVYGEDTAKYPHGYTFKKKNPLPYDFNTVSFKLQAAANKVKNAKGVTAPDLKVTWKYEPIGEIEGGSTTPTQPTQAYATVQQFGSVYMLLVKPSESTTFTGLTAVSGITSFEIKLNDGEYVSVLDKAQVYQEMAGISYTDAVAKVGTMSTNDVVTVKIVIDGVTYVATYTV